MTFPHDEASANAPCTSTMVGFASGGIFDCTDSASGAGAFVAEGAAQLVAPIIEPTIHAFHRFIGPPSSPSWLSLEGASRRRPLRRSCRCPGRRSGTEPAAGLLRPPMWPGPGEGLGHPSQMVPRE